jgi:hypothetical protein
MQTPYIGIALASVLTLVVSFPVAAAEKVAGINKDFQTLSETSANIPDKPGHTFKQVTLVWKSVSPNPAFGEAWASAVAQQDTIGTDSTERGYVTNHLQNGDVNYVSWQGVVKTAVKDGGDFESVSQGKFTWLGGTGKFKTIKGSGTYTCKFTPKGGQCDWEGEPEM